MATDKKKETCGLCTLPIKTDEARRGIGARGFAHEQCYWRNEAKAIPACRSGIKHVLEQIRYNSKVQYQLGPGTQTFTLLCIAAATLFDESVEQIAHHFVPGSGPMTKRCAEREVEAPTEPGTPKPVTSPEAK